MFKSKFIILVYFGFLASILAFRCVINPSPILLSSTKKDILKMVPSTPAKEKELTFVEGIGKKATEFKDSFVEMFQISMENAKKGEPGISTRFILLLLKIIGTK